MTFNSVDYSFGWWLGFKTGFFVNTVIDTKNLLSCVQYFI